MIGKYLSSARTGAGAAKPGQPTPPPGHDLNAPGQQDPEIRRFFGVPLNSSSLAERVSSVCSLVAALLGGITIVGWLTGVEYLASLHSLYIPMAPTTALAFPMLAFAIVALSRGGRLRTAAIVCAVFVGFVALAKLVELSSGFNVGLDEWLVAQPGKFGLVRKGRMAPLTAISFLLAAFAVCCLARPRLRRFAGFSGTGVTTIAVVVLLGYLHGTPFLYGGPIVPVALSTAIAFFFLGGALVAASGTDCWPLCSLSGSSASSLLLRWFLPVVIGGTIVNDYLQTRLVVGSDINPALASALATLAFALLISAVISQVARLVGRRIDRAEQDRNAAQADLRALNSELEERVATRTRELREKNGQLQSVLADLTHSHEALKQAQFQLIHAEKMQTVGSLAAGVAHEVKNPLAIIEMGLECLESQRDFDADSLELVHHEMREAVSRANTVISGLLDFSSARELDIRSCNLPTIVEKALRLMRHEFMNNKIAIVQSFSADVPPCQLDAPRIEQVLVNLLANSCHAMPEGGILTVSTALRRITAEDAKWDAGDRSGHRFRQDELVAEVRISDTGCGISPEAMNRIFDPFFTTKPTGQGTGLGLTVARKIVDLHNGRLELANAPDGGAVATVLFHLPLKTA
jgi:signal transduction histidine kinase